MSSMALGACSKLTIGCTNRRVASPLPAIGPSLLPCRTIHSRRCDTAAASSRGNGRGGSPGDMDFHETKLGPNVLASVKDLRDGGVKWGAATVVRNDAQSLDGRVRVLHLSVADHVDMLYGRRVKGVPDATRWIESYTIPGQCVGVRLPPRQQPPAAASPPSSAASPPRRLYSIASSPYASRRDSAYVDASLIEIVVERGSGDPEEAQLAELGPGTQLEVTQVIGRGFCSLLDSYNGVTHALEEGRNLVLIGCGSRGISALRSALSWQPLLAHAASRSAHPPAVSALYLAACAGRAAFVAEWDGWREAGILIRPLYTNPGAGLDDTAVVGEGSSSSNGVMSPPQQQGQQQASVGGGDNNNNDDSSSGRSTAAAAAVADPDLERCLDLLQQALFLHEGGFEAVCGGPASRTCFLLAGLPRELASALGKLLSARGVPYEHMLFAQADFF
ncbi:hypothetical protein Agub_g920 [Astrephomene gubernaculifera]|uniref:FAD-binding FR-type domain-containing protein n=1 Tax=Astrephomene gubernaculifera TaxID=47775 RepID=A0AAD3HGV8_9CHLO|nr:hypothetical protein Agub_g920 [Astrephomene gubernaculifera]